MLVVPMRPGQAFDPEEVTILCQVIEEVCAVLGFLDRRNKELVAKIVVKVAQSGVRDAPGLRAMTLSSFVRAA